MEKMTFELGNECVISDPCYNIENVQDCFSGTWEVEVFHDSRSPRIVGFSAMLQGAAGYTRKFLGDFGVDSGQLGIFSTEIYPEGENPSDMNDKGSFYNLACEQTLGENRCGVVDGKGFVSESGFGDGTYRVDGFFIDNVLCGISVEFIEEDEEEEDYDSFNEEYEQDEEY